MFDDQEQQGYFNPMLEDKEPIIEIREQARMALAERAKKRAKVSDNYQIKLQANNIKFPGER
jgi:hypothetical protein